MNGRRIAGDMLVLPAPSRPRALLPSLVRRLPLAAMVGLFAAHLVVMGVGATLFETGVIDAGVLFDLDAEGRYFVYFSALVLLAGAVVGVVAVSEHAAPRVALGLAGLLAFMAVDEALVLHEHLEKALDIDWPVLYAPIMAVGAVAVLVLLRTARDVRFAAPALAGGGACWAASVVLEKLAWVDAAPAAHYTALMIPEELFEVTGSFLFAVALTLLLRAGARATPAASHPR